MQPISLKFLGNIQDYGLDGYYKFQVPKGNKINVHETIRIMILSHSYVNQN